MTEPQSNSSAIAIWSQCWSLANQSLNIAMGDLNLLVQRQPQQWLFNYHWQKRGNDGPFSVTTKMSKHSSSPDSAGKLNRFADDSSGHELTLRPKLADRPVVVRPYAPLTLPAFHKITLYVSTPLWLTLNMADIHLELPTQQLSDTWMGALTGEGALCYGSHTHARLDKELLLKLPFRALTAVSVSNAGAENFVLKRLSIPAPYLSLFEGDDQLCTESLAFVMDASKHEGSVSIETRSSEVLSTAREEAEKGVLTSTWENLFA